MWIDFHSVRHSEQKIVLVDDVRTAVFSYEILLPNEKCNQTFCYHQTCRVMSGAITRHVAPLYNNHASSVDTQQHLPETLDRT